MKELETLIGREYKKANRKVRDKANLFFKQYEAKEKIKRDQFERDVITKQEYIEWRRNQLLIDSRWNEMRNTLAEDFHNANVLARQVMYGAMPYVYALNHSYGTYEVEHQSLVDTSYTLYSREAAEYILQGKALLPTALQHGKEIDFQSSDEYMMPRLGKEAAQRIRESRDVLWNRQQIQSVALQGILQGQSIPDLASCLEAVTERNHNAAIRNARTMTTNVENAGRQASYERAQKLGIEIQKTWVSTLDGRTRHEHRLLNGQTVNINESFWVEGMQIDYPGDPQAEAELVYNCRCTMVSQIKGFETDINEYRTDPALGDMTYAEWVNAKAQSEPIDKQEQIARIMKGRYAAEYRR